ncbi:MAG: GNAT family N-acetyltransferase [Bacteroidota bacterium]
MDWQLKKFKELSPIKLYNIMSLRAEVFVIEQKCIYQDADGKDAQSFHLMGFDTADKLIAYARILPAGLSYKEVSIGRVVIPKKLRRKSIGKELMLKTLDSVKNIYGNVPIRISAQMYLKEFYTDLGFVTVGDEYLEDNIPHLEMLKMPSVLS